MRKLGITITSLLLIAVLGLILVSTGLLNLPFPGYKQRTTLALNNSLGANTEEVLDYFKGAKPTLSVENPKGNIIVQGADVEEVEIVLVKRTKGITARRAEELLTQISLEIEEEEESNRLVVQLPTVTEREWAEAELTIKVPHNTDLKLHTGSGNIITDNLQGQISALNELGSIRIANHQGNAALETKLGNIQIRHSSFQKELLALTHLGDLEIEASLAENNVLESELGDLKLLLNPSEAYVLDGTLSLGEVSLGLPFKGQKSKGKIQGIVGEGKQRGTIFTHVELGSLQLRDERNGRE